MDGLSLGPLARATKELSKGLKGKAVFHAALVAVGGASASARETDKNAVSATAIARLATAHSSEFAT